MDFWMLLFGVLVLVASIGTVLIPWHHETKKRYADWHHRCMMDQYWLGWNDAIEAINKQGNNDEQRS